MRKNKHSRGGHRIVPFTALVEEAALRELQAPQNEHADKLANALGLKLVAFS